MRSPLHSFCAGGKRRHGVGILIFGDEGKIMTGVMRGRRAVAKKFLVLLGYFAVLLTNVTAQGLDTTDYFPLHVGDRWWLSGLFVGSIYIVRHFEVVETKTFGDTVYFAVDSTTFYRKDSVGNVYKRENGIDQLYFKITARTKEKWIVNFGVWAYEMSLELDSVDVQTSAGLLHKCKIFRLLRAGFISEPTYFTLAPGLGLSVYQTFEEMLTLRRAVINGTAFRGPFHILQVAPQQGQRNVDTTSTVQFRFDTVIDTNLAAQRIKLSSNKAGEIAGVVRFTRDYTQLFTFYPSRTFLLGDTITVRISGEIIDIFGQGLDGNGNGIYEGSPLDDYSWNFSTQIVTGVGDREPTIPSGFLLQQNYPNPFNPSTTIKYRLPERAFVRLTVYDVLGREVRMLVQEQQDAGVHSVEFRGDGLTSGVYFYKLTVGTRTLVGKAILLK